MDVAVTDSGDGTGAQGERAHHRHDQEGQGGGDEQAEPVLAH